MDLKKKIIVLLACMAVTFSPSLPAQSTGNVVLKPHEGLFCMMVALHVAGYNPGPGSKESSLLQHALNAELGRTKIPSRAALESFYESHRIAGDPGANLGQYISLALLLSSPPDFKLTVKEEDLPPDAARVADFVPLLRKFYSEVRLGSRRSRLQVHYEKEISRYSAQIREAITKINGYLRIPGAAYLGRTYSIILELLSSPSLVQARIYGANYFLVAAPLDEIKMEEIQHQYLHFVLDPLAAKHVQIINKKRVLGEVAQKASRLSSEYKADFPLLATESLIRAIEIRMSYLEKSKKTDRSRVEYLSLEERRQVQEVLEEGFILAPYFLSALVAKTAGLVVKFSGSRNLGPLSTGFEGQAKGMNGYLPLMFEEIKLDQEEKRLRAVKFSKPAVVPLPPRLSKRERLLQRANNRIAEGRFLEAKDLFELAVDKYGQNDEDVLFGLGVASSNLRKPGLAQRYFTKALEVSRDSRISTWSHIFLGRIHDLSGRRREALSQYQAAMNTAGAFPLALQAAEKGLQMPFGSGLPRASSKE